MDCLQSQHPTPFSIRKKKMYLFHAHLRSNNASSPFPTVSRLTYDEALKSVQHLLSDTRNLNHLSTLSASSAPVSLLPRNLLDSLMAYFEQECKAFLEAHDQDVSLNATVGEVLTFLTNQVEDSIFVELFQETSLFGLLQEIVSHKKSGSQLRASTLNFFAQLPSD